MKKISVLAAVALSILTASSQTADAQGGSPSSITGLITAIGTGWGGTGMYFTTNQQLPSGNGAIFIPVGAAQYQETLTLATMAMTLQKTVTFYYNSSSCVSGQYCVYYAMNVVN